MSWGDSKKIQTFASGLYQVMPELHPRVQKFDRQRRSRAYGQGNPLPKIGVAVPTIPYRQFLFYRRDDGDWAVLIYSVDEAAETSTFLRDQIRASVMNREAQVPSWALGVILAEAITVAAQVNEGVIEARDLETRIRLDRMSEWIPRIQSKIRVG